MSEFDHNAEETLFAAALCCLPSERGRFLDEACAGQPRLRRRIEQMIEIQGQLGEFMACPAGDTAQSQVAIAAEPEESPGNLIGRYKLLQKLGEGGCGAVYLAEQQEPVRRQVALKVIKLGMDTRSVIARFEAERQVLALMDHPNIAKIFDAGATESGRPYFVMELVRGRRITDFCDQQRLSTKDRLTLFIQVCQAVQHAHQKGIIHRDIKPSNVLVAMHNPGTPGTPKIIDFGIAKATQGRLTDQTQLTAFSQVLGTPAYMSPEQATLMAQEVDTRSDIYSLGVLLYELMTSRTPFDTKQLLRSGIEEMRLIIRDMEPARPSSRMGTLVAIEQTIVALARKTQPAKLIQALRGDLDWIVMKCLEKDPARRYETANALATDVERHLGNEPVLARPPSRVYELQKILKRHKAGFAATLAMMIVLTAGVMVSSVAAVRARRAEAEARHTAYLADMDLANRAIQEDDLGTAQALLRRHDPRTGGPGLANWEWRYLAKLSDGDPHVPLIAHSSYISSFRFLDDNTLLTAGKADWRAVLWNLSERRPAIILTNNRARGSFSEVIAVSHRRKKLYYRAAWRRSSAVIDENLSTNTPPESEPAKRLWIQAAGPVVSLDISQDQNLLAVASSNRVDLWDLDRNVMVSQFQADSGLATQGLFLRDSRQLLVASESGWVTFWNLANQEKIGSLRTASSSPGILSLSTNGRWLVNPSGGLNCQVWDVEKRTLVITLQDSAFVERAAFSPDGNWLATVGGDSTVRLWNTVDWQKRRTLRGHTDPITAVDFSPDSRQLATGSSNGEVKLWSLEDPVNTPEHVSFPAATDFKLADDGSAFGVTYPVIGTEGHPQFKADVWTTSPFRLAFTVTVPGDKPSTGIVLSKGRGLVLGGFDGKIRLVGPVVGNQSIVVRAHEGEVYLMEASQDGSTLATRGIADGGAPEKQLRLWKLPQLEPLAEWVRFENVHAIKLSNDGRYLAGFTGFGDMGIWEVPSMKGPPMWRALPRLHQPRESVFSPDNRQLAAITFQGDAYLWDLATQQRTMFQRSMAPFHSISFSPDGSRLVAGSEVDSKLFDTATGRTVLSFKAPGLKLSFDQDGERLFALHRQGAFVLQAPSLTNVKFAWLNTTPSLELLPYHDPDPNYERPDRPKGR